MSLANVNQPNQIYHITAEQSKQASKHSKEVTERVFVLLMHSLSDEPTSREEDEDEDEEGAKKCFKLAINLIFKAKPLYLIKLCRNPS